MDFNLGQELIRILKEGGRTFEATRDMADGLVESTAQLPKGAAFTKPNTAPRITKAGSKMLLEMMQKRAAHAVVMSLQMCCTLEEIAQRTESPEYQIFGQMTFQVGAQLQHTVLTMLTLLFGCRILPPCRNLPRSSANSRLRLFTRVSAC